MITREEAMREIVTEFPEVLDWGEHELDQFVDERLARRNAESALAQTKERLAFAESFIEQSKRVDVEIVKSRSALAQMTAERGNAVGLMKGWDQFCASPSGPYPPTVDDKLDEILLRLSLLLAQGKEEKR